MIVKTEQNNDRAISFYKSKGFVEQDNKVEDGFGTKVNFVVLRLELL